jgi:hypothetical protein
MRKVPSQFQNPHQHIDAEILETAQKQLTALGYEKWLKTQNRSGYYNSPEAQYHPSTVKEFLIDYRKEKQNEWNINRLGTGIEDSEFGRRKRGYEALDGNNLATYNILSPFYNYSDSDIKNLDTNKLNSFISNVYENKNRNFNDVNKVNSNKPYLPLRAAFWSISSLLSLFKTSKEESAKKDGPLNQPPAISRTRSMPINYKEPYHLKRTDSESNLGKRKRNSSIDQQPHKRTKSGIGLSYSEAFRSGDIEQLKKAESARFDKYKQEEERQEAEKRRKEEERRKKAQKPQSPPQRPSNLPSPSASLKPLIDPRTGRPIPAPQRQCSPFTRSSTNTEPKKLTFGERAHLDQRPISSRGPYSSGLGGRSGSGRVI